LAEAGLRPPRGCDQSDSVVVRAILVAAVVVSVACASVVLLQQRTSQTCISATSTGHTVVSHCLRRPGGAGRAVALLIAAGALAALGIAFRRDLLAVVIGTALASVGLAAALVRHWDRADLGPTAASLNEAFGVFLGVALGLLAGSFVASIVARREPRIVAGCAAGLLSYGLLVLLDAVSGSGDVGLSEKLTFDLALVFPFGVFVAVGATLGTLARTAPRVMRRLR
jgi:hypothetical protein